MIYMHCNGQRSTLMLRTDGTGCLWQCPRFTVESIPINNCAGKKAELTDVSMGIGCDVVFTVHVSSCQGRPNEGLTRAYLYGKLYGCVLL